MAKDLLVTSWALLGQGPPRGGGEIDFLEFFPGRKCLGEAEATPWPRPPGKEL